jgi:hypothetical protein
MAILDGDLVMVIWVIHWRYRRFLVVLVFYI